jgi:hypothetical protein
MLDEEWYEDHYCIVTEDTVFELREDSKAVTACIPNRYSTWVEEDTPETPSKYGNTNLFRHVYFETCGWAPIYEEPVKYSLLKGNDIVIFDGPNGPRKYTVNWTCLSLAGRDNDIIFQDLGVDKYQLASKMYGYSVHIGDWPSFITKDYKAATNLVNELHRLCAEARSSAPTQSNSKTTISYEQEKHPRNRSISFQPKSVILQGDDIKISRVQTVRASGIRCPTGEIKCRSGNSY